MLTKIEKTCSINKWQTQHQKVLCIYECLKFELCCGTICIQSPTYIIHAASFHYLTHITNASGCMEILPTHCGAGSVKVNYYRCMRKIWGLVKPHKVNKRHMRLSYCRFISTWQNTNNLTQRHCDRVIRFGVICFCLKQIKLLQAKMVFRMHIQRSLWCFSLASKKWVSSVFCQSSLE